MSWWREFIAEQLGRAPELLNPPKPNPVRGKPEPDIEARAPQDRPKE